MNKKTLIVSFCFLLFFLTSCSQPSKQSSKNTSSNNSSTSSNLHSNSELMGQDVSDITKLATPDEIVYLHEGVKTTYPKDSPKFNKIIQKNKVRQTKKLDACKCMIDVASNGDYLIYNYTSTNYAPVYFKVVPSPDERFENNVFNYYGTKLPDYAKKYDKSKIDVYGHLAPADELLAYLKN